MKAIRLGGRLLAYAWRKWWRAVARWIERSTCEHDLEYGHEPDAIYPGVARCGKCGRIWFDVDDIEG